MGEMTQQYSYSCRDSAPAYMYSTALVGQFIGRAGHTSYHYLIQKFVSVVYKLLRVNVITMKAAKLLMPQCTSKPQELLHIQNTAEPQELTHMCALHDRKHQTIKLYICILVLSCTLTTCNTTVVKHQRC